MIEGGEASRPGQDNAVHPAHANPPLPRSALHLRVCHGVSGEAEEWGYKRSGTRGRQLRHALTRLLSSPLALLPSFPTVHSLHAMQQSRHNYQHALLNHTDKANPSMCLSIKQRQGVLFMREASPPPRARLSWLLLEVPSLILPRCLPCLASLSSPTHRRTKPRLLLVCLLPTDTLSI